MDDAVKFEPNERYAELVGKLSPPSFGGIRSIAKQLLNENFSTPKKTPCTTTCNMEGACWTERSCSGATCTLSRPCT